MNRVTYVLLVLILMGCTKALAELPEYPASIGKGSISHRLPNGFIDSQVYSHELAIKIALGQNTPNKRVRIGTKNYDGTAIIYVTTKTNDWIGKIGRSRLILPDRPGQVFKSPVGKTYIKEYYYDIPKPKWGWTDMDSEETNVSCPNCPSL